MTDIQELVEGVLHRRLKLEKTNEGYYDIWSIDPKSIERSAREIIKKLSNRGFRREQETMTDTLREAVKKAIYDNTELENTGVANHDNWVIDPESVPKAADAVFAAIHEVGFEIVRPELTSLREQLARRMCERGAAAVHSEHRALLEGDTWRTLFLPEIDAILDDIIEIGPDEGMIEAGWIDKEDVNPDDIFCAMLRAAKEEGDE